MKTILLFFVTLLFIGNGIMAQRTFFAPGGDENGIGIWEDPDNWTLGLPGSTTDGRAIFKGGECFVNSDVTGTFRVELGDNKNANYPILTVENGGIVGALRVGGGHSEVGIWAPAKLVVEEGGTFSTLSHLWIGATKSYSLGADAHMGSEVHINGGTIIVGEMFGIDFYNDKEFSGGTLFMNGGLLDLAQWNPGDPENPNAVASLGKHGKIEYTAGLIQIAGNYKASLERFRDNGQITGTFEIWVEEETTMVDDGEGNQVAVTTYITKLSNEAPADASLSGLTVSEGTLNREFDADVYTYYADLTEGTTVTPSVTATAADAGAAVVVTDAADVTSEVEADRTTTVVVTAVGGERILTYRIVFQGAVSTSVSELFLDEVSIYPNPFSTELKIENVSSFTRVELINLFGQQVQVLETHGENAISMTTSNLDRGVYVVNLYIGNEIVGSRKVIKN